MVLDGGVRPRAQPARFEVAQHEDAHAGGKAAAERDESSAKLQQPKEKSCGAASTVWVPLARPPSWRKAPGRPARPPPDHASRRSLIRLLILAFLAYLPTSLP